jgi:hypothetical protein
VIVLEASGGSFGCSFSAVSVVVVEAQFVVYEIIISPSIK